ncbi:MAG TPA: NAD(P)/FAD-dependent oxidoreductase [Alphaproteobacteria bacterium]
MDFKTDVTIVGAGPAGLFAVFECGMLGLKCHVVDALPEIGGQCTALYPEKPIYDIPAHPSILAGDLIVQLEAQAKPFEPHYHTGQTVTELKSVDGRFHLTTSAGNTIDSATIIIAAGPGAFGPNKPPIKGIESYEGKSVFYMVRKRADFAGKRVVIAGGGDSAVDWALSLSEIAEKVYVVHRRDGFRAAPESVQRLHLAAANGGKIEMVIPYQLKNLEGADGLLTGVQVANLDGAEKMLQADALLAFFGLAAKLGPIAEWGLGIHANHIDTNPTTGATNVPGIYAIGDVANYENKIRLILTGFSEAASAAHAAWRYMHPGQDLHMEYSTGKGVPGQKGADIKTIAV